jgi:hypothetical protein
VYLPSGMQSVLSVPLTNAINGWNDAVSGTSPTLSSPTTTNCGTGATCIQFEEGLIPPDENGVFPCAQRTATYNSTTGALTSAKIRMQEGWWNVNPRRLQRTVAHELGHLLGLKEADSTCAGSNSIMRSGVYACDASGVPNTVTLNDSLPVEKGVYGGGSRLSCGF